MEEKIYTDKEIIAGYKANYDGEPSCFWAEEEMSDILAVDPERAWGMTCEMINQTTDDAFLAYIAAGPLENLLAYHGPTMIERVEDMARKDSHFRQALACVWGHTRFNSDIYARVRKAIGDIKPL